MHLCRLAIPVTIRVNQIAFLKFTRFFILLSSSNLSYIYKIFSNSYFPFYVYVYKFYA